MGNCYFQPAGGAVAFPSFNVGLATVLTADGAAMVEMIVPTDRMKWAVVSSSHCFRWEAERLAGWLLFFFCWLSVTMSLKLSSSCIAAVSVVGFPVLVQASLLSPLSLTFYPK